MANRSRDYYRKMRKKAITRKEKIINSYMPDGLPYHYDYYMDYDPSYGDISPYWKVKSKGCLAKGKIHCSCPMCAFHGTSMQDRRKFISMESKLADYYEDSDAHDIPNLLMLKEKIRKEINGIYYPNSSGKDTSAVNGHKDSKTFDYNEFREIINLNSLILDDWIQVMIFLVSGVF